MADNTQLSTNIGVGDVIATDDIGGTKYPRSKITLGIDGVNDGDVSATNPLPVTTGTGITLPISDLTEGRDATAAPSKAKVIAGVDTTDTVRTLRARADNQLDVSQQDVLHTLDLIRMELSAIRMALTCLVTETGTINSDDLSPGNFGESSSFYGVRG